jgi:hypothetical protein
MRTNRRDWQRIYTISISRQEAGLVVGAPACVIDRVGACDGCAARRRRGCAKDGGLETAEITAAWREPARD